MNLCLIGHNFRYELEKLVRIFMPFEKIEFFSEITDSECSAISVLTEDCAKAVLKLNKAEVSASLKLESLDEKE